MVYLIYFFQSFARCHWFGAVNTAGKIDCEQSLFFFRFSEGSARLRECRAARNEVGIPRRKKRVSFLVPLPSRALNHERGHLRVSRVLLDGPRKKRDCL